MEDGLFSSKNLKLLIILVLAGVFIKFLYKTMTVTKEISNTYGEYSDRLKTSEANTFLISIYAAAKAHWTENGEYPKSIESLSNIPQDELKKFKVTYAPTATGFFAEINIDEKNKLKIDESGSVKKVE